MYIFMIFQDNGLPDHLGDPVFLFWLSVIHRAASGAGGFRAGLEFEVNTDIAALLDWDFELRPYLNLTYMTTYKDRDTGKN